MRYERDASTSIEPVSNADLIGQRLYPESNGPAVQPKVPDGFLVIALAYSQLMAGVWGGIRRPFRDGRRRIESRERKEYSDRRLTAAVLDGSIVVHAFAENPLKPVEECRTYIRDRKVDPQIVPVNRLKKLTLGKVRIPGRIVGPVRGYAVDKADDTPATTMVYWSLTVRRVDFNRWYRAERDRGKWPSQRSRRKKQLGRPTRQTTAIRSRILELVDGKQWSRQAGIPKLRDFLDKDKAALGDVPSVDTLGRLVEKLRIETGLAAFNKKAPRHRR